MTEDPPSWLLVPLSALLILLWRRWQSTNQNMLPLPPGPRPLPIIGNLLDVPRHDMEVHYREMNTRHGNSPGDLVPPVTVILIDEHLGQATWVTSMSADSL